jgi:hypothetical protein
MPAAQLGQITITIAAGIVAARLCRGSLNAGERHLNPG